MSLSPEWVRQNSHIIMHVFIQWLANKNLLDQWMNGVLEQRNDDMKLKHTVNNMNIRPFMVIDQSFIWSNTGDSRPWVVLDREWSEVCHKLIKILEDET